MFLAALHDVFEPTKGKLEPLSCFSMLPQDTCPAAHHKYSRKGPGITELWVLRTILLQNLCLLRHSPWSCLLGFANVVATGSGKCI
ncbi:hypothetical protein CY34DRAFT_810788 [Suillus luteus UH-Slu-Lm8-n1]|uniref:Uncharacterized protein n=1 Tax=Suillus luteus UH-Slu-Lm8-n1 TaxID=930992 RepID=A0A0C9ZI15_9AGAM|nr:hypothetical protein CY34DRAFT_810788 [Suillus luteus UH-Slu-Lm8-n1]